MSDLWEKLNLVMKPMSVNFWKEFKEEASFGSLGAAPCPAMGQVTSGRTAAATVNGLPVPSESVYAGKKKKRKKKNEDQSNVIIISQQDINDFNLEEVKSFFKLNIQGQEVFNNCLQDTIKIFGKSWTETQSHVGKSPLLLLFKYLDSILETAQGDTNMVANTKSRKDNIIGWYYL